MNLIPSAQIRIAEFRGTNLSGCPFLDHDQRVPLSRPHGACALRVLGASGSGKSTLLRCLNFMEMPGAGAIALDGRPVGRSGAAKPL